MVCSGRQPTHLKRTLLIRNNHSQLTRRLFRHDEHRASRRMAVRRRRSVQHSAVIPHHDFNRAAVASFARYAPASTLHSAPVLAASLPIRASLSTPPCGPFGINVTITLSWPSEEESRVVSTRTLIGIVIAGCTWIRKSEIFVSTVKYWLADIGNSLGPETPTRRIYDPPGIQLEVNAPVAGSHGASPANASVVVPANWIYACCPAP